MPTSVSPSLVTRIRGVLTDLPIAERRLAELVMDFPGDVASYSASELARLANVSNATVSRFVKRLDYENFEDARRHVRSEREAGSPLLQTGVKPRGAIGSLDAHRQQAHANIDGTYRRLDEVTIGQISQAVVDARRVWVLGFRASHGLAAYLRWQMIQVVDNIVLLPGPGETLAENLSSVADGDVMIAFALRRRVAIFPQVIRQVLDTGCRIALITNAQTDPLPATWTLRCDTQAAGPLDEHVSVMAVCHLLATRVMEGAGVAGRRRLSAVEAAYDALGEL